MRSISFPTFLNLPLGRRSRRGGHQRKCYQAVDPYTQIPCAGTGQDGAYVFNPLSYTDNGDGTVTDNNTGLEWQQEDDKTPYNWYQASGTYDATYNPATASVCGLLTLGGHADWRLPNKKELMSIVNYAIPYPGPTIATGYFPNTIAAQYWSSTTDAEYPEYAWYVYFGDGNVYVYDSLKDFGYYVRCVRGGQTEQSLIDNHNGTVTDSRTGLTWQQGEPGAMTWSCALGYCEGLNLGGSSNWRLPNVKELESLTDDTRSNPAIDTTFFSGALPFYYWSSTTYVYYSFPESAWGVDFNDGLVHYSRKYSNIYYVRCVRGGQSGLFGIAGTVRTNLGTPLSGVNITLARAGTSPVTVRTNIRGRFSFAGLTGNRLGTIRLWKRGWAFIPRSRRVLVAGAFLGRRNLTAVPR